MLKHMRIFLTGGTGFVGRHLARRLCALGAEVTALVRESSDSSVLPAKVRLVAGSLGLRESTPAQLHEILAGTEVVIHCAARLFAGSLQEYMQTNYHGTQRLAGLIAAHGRNIRQVILLSSLAAAGPCGKAPGIDEKALPAPVSAYGWSKLAAEGLMEKYLGQDRLLILRPPVVYGPEDKALPALFSFAARGLVLQAGCRVAPCSFLYVDDLLDALLLCLRRPEAAGLYHLEDGRPSSLREFGELIARASGHRPRHIILPHALLRLAAQGACLASRCLSKEPFPLTPDKALEGRQEGWLANGAKFRQEFGFTAKTSLAAGIDNTLRWWTRTKRT